MASATDPRIRASQGALPHQQHDQDDHERYVQGRQNHAAPDGQLQMLAFSAKIGHEATR